MITEQVQTCQQQPQAKFVTDTRIVCSPGPQAGTSIVPAGNLCAKNCCSVCWVQGMNLGTKCLHQRRASDPGACVYGQKRCEPTSTFHIAQQFVSRIFSKDLFGASATCLSAEARHASADDQESCGYVSRAAQSANTLCSR